MNEPQIFAEVLNTYTLQLMGPRAIMPEQFVWQEKEGVAAGIRPEFLRQIERQLTELLPYGYSVRIKEWDSDE